MWEKAGKASQGRKHLDWAWLRFRYKEIEGNLFSERENCKKEGKKLENSRARSGNVLRPVAWSLERAKKSKVRSAC